MPTKEQLEMARQAAKKTDWSRIDAMTDEEIEAAAKADPDSIWPTKAELDAAVNKAKLAKTAAE